MSGLDRLAKYMMVIGLGVSAVAVGAELAGLGNRGFGARQLLLVILGLAILSAGVIVDWFRQGRTLRRWRADVFPEDHVLTAFVTTVTLLFLLVLVVRQYELHNQAFFLVIMPLTTYGFVIHTLLPVRFRLPFFVLLSLAAITSVLGLSNSAWLLVLGLLLIGLCHLPVSFAARISLIALFAGVLAVMRGGWLESPWPSSIWPVLASMFMFRIIVYLYDLRHDRGSRSLTHGLAYFFVLPNVVFTLFPVIDYETFCHTYESRNLARVHQEGVFWIFRGVTHLLIYRFVNYYLAIPVDEVVDTGSLLTFLVTNYLLYLNVSGQFHIAIGILKLFDFDLPRTNYFYYLASSFTDFWRRINIYWKDFMMKVFYYPVYFYTRRWGGTVGLILSTLVVFIATWFLHSYQWFWLRGSLPLTLNDSLFWGILAVLVLTNAMYELKYRRHRIISVKEMRLGPFLGLGLRTLGTYSTICVLWALWAAESVDQWLDLFTVVDTGVGGVSRLLMATLCVGAGMILLYGVLYVAARAASWGQQNGWASAVAFTSLTALYVLGNPAVLPLLGENTAEIVRDLRVPRLGMRDAAMLQRGYYEELLGVNRFNSELWEMYARRPDTWVMLADTEAGRLTGDFMFSEHVPRARIVFHGAPFSTNRFGMRDREYDLSPPDGTYRIGLLGSSIVAGWGVGDDETFEAILENRINERVPGGGIPRFELLNFAVGGHSALQEMRIFETQALSFGLDAVIYVAHPDGAVPGDGEIERTVGALARMVEEDVEVPYEYLRGLLRRAGLEAGTGAIEGKRKLSAFNESLMSWVYGRIVGEAAQRGALPIWVLLPIEPGVEAPENEVASLIALAHEAGFQVLDLSGVFDGQDPASLIVAEWDHHPNARANLLIANELHRALSELGETPVFPSISTESDTER